jgi:hypothetical protein
MIMYLDNNISYYVLTNKVLLIIYFLCSIDIPSNQIILTSIDIKVIYNVIEY